LDVSVFAPPPRIPSDVDRWSQPKLNTLNGKKDKALAGKKIVLYSSDEHDKKSNAALLIALYAVRFFSLISFCDLYSPDHAFRWSL
jgi:hypothetical protein